MKLVYNGQITKETLHNLFPNMDEHKSEKSMVRMAVMRDK